MGLGAALVAAGYANGQLRAWALDRGRDERPAAPRWSASAVAGASSVGAPAAGRGSAASAPASGRVLLDCAAHALAVRCVRLRYSDDADAAAAHGLSRAQVVAGSNDRAASLWDFRAPCSGRSSAAAAFGGHRAPVTCLEDGLAASSSGGGRDVVTGCADGSVRVFDLRHPKCAKLELKAHRGHSDGCYALVALRKFVVVLKPAAQGADGIGEGSGEGGGGEERLLSAARNGAVCEWSLSTGDLLRRWSADAAAASSAGHGDARNGCSFMAACAFTEAGFVGSAGVGAVQRWDLAWYI
jgi:WD40 repeat protein